MKKYPLSYVLLLFFFASFLNCNTDEGGTDVNTVSEFETYIQDEMESQNIPALSVTIFKENTVLYEKYLGLSNIQSKVPLANNHLFLMASVSKVVTATALLQLLEKGEFSLNDKVNDFLPFKVNVPNSTEAITFKMLLTHTSGIADGSALDNQYFYGKDSPVALGYFLENYLVVGGKYYNASENFHNFNPGTVYEYSNIGNALIGLLVEEISGMDFDTYCKKNIFNPLGMKDTYWKLDEISKTIVTPYDYENGVNKAIQHYTFTDYPNGGLRSTGTDMFRFLSAFTQGGLSNNVKLLSAETVNSMITSQIPLIDNEVGLHLFLMNANNNLWGHDGGEQGVATIVAFNPITKVGAIILSNQGEADLDAILVKAYQLGLNL